MLKKAKAARRKRITAKLASKVLEVVDAGLSSGLGHAEPGSMCVEAAVCYAMGEPHTDQPTCVTRGIRDTKIGLNDHDIWVTGHFDGNDAKVKKLRSNALRRIAIAQLGSRGVITDAQWVAALRDYLLKHNPQVKKDYAEYKKKAALLKKQLVELITSLEAGDGAFTGCLEDVEPFEVDTDPDYLLHKVKTIKGAKKVCEDLVQILIKLKSPGTKFLYLTEKPKAKGRKFKAKKSFKVKKAKRKVH